MAALAVTLAEKIRAQRLAYAEKETRLAEWCRGQAVEMRAAGYDADQCDYMTARAARHAASATKWYEAAEATA